MKNKMNFSDFWTLDMKKFYDDSWGQENYNIKKIQSSMPANPSKWKIIPIDKCKAEIKKDQFSKRRSYCRLCEKFGHEYDNCTQLKKPIKCSVCGVDGHYDYRCPNALCTKCGRSTSVHKKSCRKCFKIKYLQCSICKSLGHKFNHCPDLWRRYHITTKDPKHVIKSSNQLKEISKRWCSNCAKQGHFEDTCNKGKRDYFPIKPNIISYDPVYGIKFSVEELSCDKTLLPTTGNNTKKRKRKKKSEINDKKKSKKHNIKDMSNKADIILKNLNSDMQVSKNKIRKLNKIRKKMNKLNKISDTEKCR